jgi:Response regulator receiver domain
VSDATTILLIDDDRDYRAYCAQRLHASARNYDVVEAATGQAGLDLCARQPIDCVVLEIDLPDMPGFEVQTCSKSLFSRPFRQSSCETDWLVDIDRPFKPPTSCQHPLTRRTRVQPGRAFHALFRLMRFCPIRG